MKLMIMALAIAFQLTPVNAAELSICQGGDRKARKVTCLVDGDTGWENGVKWRLKNIDTPEYPPRAECLAEQEAAKEATYRLLELMRNGYTIIPAEETGRYGRDLVNIQLENGRDVGELLIAEGLAQPWPNSGNVWCR